MGKSRPVKYELASDEVVSAIREHLVGDVGGVCDCPIWEDYECQCEGEPDGEGILSTMCVVKLISKPTIKWWKDSLSSVGIRPERLYVDNIPEGLYLVRYSETGNYGWNVLYSVVDGVATLYTADGDIEYGASGPAYNGCYSEESRKEILEWVDRLVSELEAGEYVWF